MYSIYLLMYKLSTSEMQGDAKSLELLAFFGLQALLKPPQVHHHARVRPRADFLVFVARAYFEFNPPAVDFRHFGDRGDLMPGRRRGEMLDVDNRADCAFARVEIIAHRVERGVLHGCYHHGRGEDLRQGRVLELIGEVRRHHAQRVGFFRTHWNRFYLWIPARRT